MIAYGINNVYESASPIIYENSQAGPLRELYRKAAKLAGMDNDAGDLGYSGIKVLLSIHAAIRSLVLSQNPGRLVNKYLFKKPGAGKSPRYVNNDYITKWASKNGVMKIYHFGKSAYNLKTKLYDSNYNVDDNYTLNDPIKP